MAGPGDGRLRALRDVPWDDEALDERDEVVEHEAEHREDHDGREEQGSVEVGVRPEQQISETLGRANELSDHRADYRERDRDLHAREQVRQGGWQADLAEDRPPSPAHRADEARHVGVGRAKAGHRVEQDREEADEECHEHLGSGPEAEPDDEEGRERDLGDRLQQHQERIHDALEPAEGDDEHRGRDADEDSEQESGNNLSGGDERGSPELDAVLPRDSTIRDGLGSRYSGMVKMLTASCQMTTLTTPTATGTSHPAESRGRRSRAPVGTVATAAVGVGGSVTERAGMRPPVMTSSSSWSSA